MSGYGLTRDRVMAVVVALDDGTEQVGSGYLVADRLVLTAEHATRNKDSASMARMTGIRAVQVATGASVEVKGALATDPDLDVAILEILEPTEGWSGSAPVMEVWGIDRSVPGILDDCVVIGLPRFAYDPARGLHGSAELHGRVNQTDGAETGHLLMRDPTLHGVNDPESGRSGWNGLSGALVFFQGRALGVVVEHHPSEGDNTVRLIGFGPIAANPKLRAALGLPEPSSLMPAPAGRGVALAAEEHGQGDALKLADIARCWADLSGSVLLPLDIRSIAGAINQSGTAMAVAANDGTVTTLRYDGTKQRFRADARMLAFPSEWECWFSGPRMGISRLDLRSGSSSVVVDKPGQVLAVAAGRDCVVAASIPQGKTGGRLIRIDSRTKESAEFKATLGERTGIAVDPHGQLCAYQNLRDPAHTQVVLMSLQNGATLWKCDLLTLGVGQLAFSSDGLSLGLADAGNVVLWRNVYKQRTTLISVPRQVKTLAFGDDDRIAVSAPWWSGVLDASRRKVLLQIPWRHCMGAQIIGDVLVSYGSEVDPTPPALKSASPSSRWRRLTRFAKDVVSASSDGGLVVDVRPAPTAP